MFNSCGTIEVKKHKASRNEGVMKCICNGDKTDFSIGGKAKASLQFWAGHGWPLNSCLQLTLSENN